MTDETRVYTTTETWDPARRMIHCKTGMHQLTKVADVVVAQNVQICTADELATVICEYLDAKLARQAGETDG